MTSTNPEVLLFMPLSSPGLRLQAHPATPCPWIDSITARAHWLRAGVLLFDYIFSGDIARLCVPPPQPACHTDRLWQHTCCEAFVAAVDGVEYREFNLSPSGQWAAYRFLAYRERDAAFVPPFTPQSDFQRLADGFRMTALLAPELLPPTAVFQIGLTLVLETTAGGKSYWALAHCAAQPDFHLRQSFTLTLARPICRP